MQEASLSIFRQYDIRGIYEKELTQKMVKNIGYFFAKNVKKCVKDAKYISIGYDARTHSKRISSWLISGINYAGLEVLNASLVPTPVNYFSNFTSFNGKTSSASIMITGSHNPPQYNGFKCTIDKKPFFGQDIYALSKDIIKNAIDIPDNDKSIEIDAKKQYIDYLVNSFSHLDLHQNFVFDCGNGAAGVVLEEILDRLKIRSKILFKTPDGSFPNHHPDPSVEKNLQSLKKSMQEEDFTLGFAYDGDADRIAVLSKTNNFKGDMLAIFFSKTIKDPVIIGEVKCSQIMYDTINSYGKAIMYKTGHSNLKEKIAQTKASLAAEVSGHIFFNDKYFGYDDAIYATLRVLDLVHRGVNLDDELAKLPKLFSTDEINIDVAEDEKFAIIEQLAKDIKTPPKDFPKIKQIIDIDGLRVVFEDGWGLIRASNTTPKLVTRFEATSKEKAMLYQEKLLSLI